MEISNEIMKKCSQKLLLARMRLLQNNGFYGILLMHMKFALSEDLETATVDDKKLYFNPEFVMALSDRETEYVIMHLVTHVALRHTLRGIGLKQERFYEACDIVVNSNILRSCNMDEKSISLKSEGGVQPHFAPDGTEGYEHSVEELYEMLLLKEAIEDELDSDDDSEKSDDFDNVKSDELGEDDSDGESDSNGNDSKRNSNSNGGRSGKNKGKGWDEHDEKKSESEGDVENADLEWKQRLIEAAEMSERREKILIEERSNMRGTVPLFAQRALEELRNPQTDWRQILDEFVQEEINDYSFTPPDRRFDDSPFFLPDFNEKDDSVEDILFMVDTSGSMNDDDVADCYSEIKGAIDQFDGKLTGWLGFFDATVVDPKRFEDEDEFKIIRPKGGGGTSFRCIFDYVSKYRDEIDPVSIIILTDGYAPFPDENVSMDIPVLWIINNENVVPPWGKVARITNRSVNNRR